MSTTWISSPMFRSGPTLSSGRPAAPVTARGATVIAYPGKSRKTARAAIALQHGFARPDSKTAPRHPLDEAVAPILRFFRRGLRVKRPTGFPGHGPFLPAA